MIRLLLGPALFAIAMAALVAVPYVHTLTLLP